MARSRTATRWAAGAAVAAILGLGSVGCSSTPDDPTAPGTSAVLGGSGSSSPSTTVASNSEEGTSSNEGSIAEQRPPMGQP